MTMYPNEVPWIMLTLYDASIRQMVPERNDPTSTILHEQSNPRDTSPTACVAPFYDARSVLCCDTSFVLAVLPRQVYSMFQA